jgi:hypothetical protein
MIGFWQVHFRQSGRMLCDEHTSRELAIDDACNRWLEDPQVWITGPDQEMVQSAEVERIYRDRYPADKSADVRIA